MTGRRFESARRVREPLPLRGAEPGGGNAVPTAILTVAVLIGIGIGTAVLVRVLSGPGSARVDVLVPRVDAATEGAAPLELGGVERLERWVQTLASPEFQGRDTPSVGLRRAQLWVAGCMRAAGLVPLSDVRAAPPARVEDPLERVLREADFDVRRWLHPFEVHTAFLGRTPFERPDSHACSLRANVDRGDRWRLYDDYVPLARSSVEDDDFRGQAQGPAVFAGFAIDSRAEGYDDFKNLDVRDRIAIVLSGEPSGGGFAADAFAGAEVTAEASLWNKLDALAEKGAAGALVVAEGPLAFHHTRASWLPPSFDRVRKGLPTLVVTPGVASAVLGQDVDLLRAQILRSGAPVTLSGSGASVSLSAGTVRGPATLYNVVGRLPATVADGSEPPLVIGAHLDHVGVGIRGRIALGADDNGSGVAAMLAVAHALAGLPERARDVVFCAFTGEEDGLLGSRALAGQWRSGPRRPVAMLNLDMVGFGDEARVAVFGLDTAPGLRDRMDRALAAGDHGVREVLAVEQPQFFQRSDHYAFHEVGVPVLFFFEDWPHRSRVYHTWKDTPETLSLRKIRSTAALVARVAESWL